MSKKRQYHGRDFKSKVAREAIEGDKTLSEIAAKYGVHVQQVTDWKAKALNGLPSLFDKKSKKADIEHSQDVKELRAKIGQQAMEIDFLAKGLGLVTEP
jgi:transposase